jgi:hypothetical protein
VWPDEAPLWEKKAFEADYRHLFVKRGTDEAKILAQATTYKRFRMAAVVTHVIKGQPWIEVTGLEELQGQLSEASLVHLVKGLLLRDLRRFEAAAREFQFADAESLPLPIRLICIREEALAIANAGRPAAAEKRLMAALHLVPEDPTSSAALAHIRGGLGRSRDGTPVGSSEHEGRGAESRRVEVIPPFEKH